MFAKLKYCDNLTMTINTGSGAYSMYAYQLYQSSLFDPDLTATGHQPMTFDNYCPGLYQRYRVYGFKYNIEFSNVTTANTFPIVIYTGTQPAVIATTGLAAWNTLEEQPGSRRIRLGGQSTEPKIVTGYVNVSKVYGLGKRGLQDDMIYGAVYNSNPSLMAYLHLYATALNPSSGNQLLARVQLTYYCKFYNNAQFASS